MFGVPIEDMILGHYSSRFIVIIDSSRSIFFLKKIIRIFRSQII